MSKMVLSLIALVIALSCPCIDALSCEYNVVSSGSNYVHGELWITPSSNTNGWWDLSLNFDHSVSKLDGYTTATRYASTSGNTVSNLTPMLEDQGDSFSNNNQYGGQKFKIEYRVESSSGTPNLESATFLSETCTVSSDGTSNPSQSPSPSPSIPSSGTCKLTIDDICTQAASKSFDVDYNKALQYSLQFYEAQRSGKLPSSTKAKIPWRGDSYLDDTVPGGYYDAGDNIKFLLPMAFTVTNLAWGGNSFFDGYKNAGQESNMKAALKWGTDFFLKSWNNDAKELVVQIGDGDADHKLWVRPEDHLPDYRPTFKVTKGSPGSEPAAETAAALAASAMFYEKTGDSTLANEVLTVAEELFDFAYTYQGKYDDAVPEVKAFYASHSGYKDELCWAAAFLYKATSDVKYLNLAKQNYDNNFGGPKLFFNWDNKKIGCAILLYEITEDCSYKQDVDNVAEMIINHPTMGSGAMAWVDQWGSLRLANNLGHACMQIARLGIRKTGCRNFAETQINFSLGDNSNNMSYMVGFGSLYPKNPHHRASSIGNGLTGTAAMESSASNPNILYGAVVGGPGYYNNYNDDRTNYIEAEVACDYNAGFQGALAAVVCKTN